MGRFSNSRVEEFFKSILKALGRILWVSGRLASSRLFRSYGSVPLFLGSGYDSLSLSSFPLCRSLPSVESIGSERK